MASLRENYDKLQNFIKAFPAYVEDKKDLVKIKDKSLLKDYYLYKSYFEVDKRFKPSSVITELKRFKIDNIYFKSEVLKLDLLKNPAFDSFDKYESSNKLIAKVSNSMAYQNLSLKYIDSEYQNIEIGYNQTASRKVIKFDIVNDDLSFMQGLSDDIYVNITQSYEDGKINKSSYNKNGLDFIYDYNNQSNDFQTNLNPVLNDTTLVIYQG